MPIFRLIEAHVFVAERLHGDDTTVPVMAKGKTDTARLWDYVRDDRPFGGSDPPAVVFHYSRNRRGEQTTLLAYQWGRTIGRRRVEINVWGGVMALRNLSSKRIFRRRCTWRFPPPTS